MRRLLVRHLLLLLAWPSLVGLAASTHEVNTVDETVTSAALGRSVPYRVILPAAYATDAAARFPVLYLLHGYGGTFTNWTMKTSLVDDARLYRAIIVTPEGENSWYVDGANGEKWATYLTVDLIADVDQKFHTVASREGRAIAGLSMGGYGALNAGLRHPDLFAFAGSLSGALDITEPGDVFGGERKSDVMKIFGPIGSAVRTSNDVYALAAAVDRSRAPYIWMAVGTNDPWLEPNRRFARALSARGLAYEFHETPGGHEWPFWDREVKRLMSSITGWRRDSGGNESGIRSPGGRYSRSGRNSASAAPEIARRR